MCPLKTHKKELYRPKASKFYFKDIQLCLKTVTALCHLEIGIMAGCTVSPLDFAIAMEVII